MKTIKLPIFTIGEIAKALGVSNEEIIKRLGDVPNSITKNTTLDDDLAKMIGLKYCVYFEREEWTK